MDSTPSNQGIKTIKETLKNSKLGTDLTDEELTKLAAIAIEQRFKKGATIVEEDSTARDLFILCKGQVSIRLMLPMIHFKEEVINSMSAPEIFGEFALADGAPRSATVRADDLVIVHKYKYDRLVKLMEDNTRIGYILMRNLAAIIANRIRENYAKTRKHMLGW